MNINFEKYKRVRGFSYNQYCDFIAENPELLLDDYDICQNPGIYEGRLILKKWGGSQNLVSYVDCTEKHHCKIAVCTFSYTDYLGLADIPMGSMIRMKFIQAKKSGKVRLGSVELITDNDGGASDE